MMEHRSAAVGVRQFPYPTRKTTKPCVICQKPIAPGQLYVVVSGPRHLGCS